MAKINKDYKSLYHYLLDRLFPKSISPNEFHREDGLRHFRYNFPFQSDVLELNRNTESHRQARFKPYRIFPEIFGLDDTADDDMLQLIGAFQPLLDMKKDAADTFKPYKIKMHVLRDMAQLIFGLGNMVKSVLTLAIAPLVFLFDIITYPFIKKNNEDYPEFVFKNFVRLLSWIIDGVLSAIRGATQIAFTPFLLFKIPYRLTLGSGKVEDNTGLRLVIAETERLAEIPGVADAAKIMLKGEEKTCSERLSETKAQPDEHKIKSWWKRSQQKMSVHLEKAKEFGKEVVELSKEIVDDVVDVLVNDEQVRVENPIVEQKKNETDNSAHAKKLITALYEIHRKTMKANHRGQVAYNGNIFNEELQGINKFTADNLTLAGSEDINTHIKDYVSTFKTNTLSPQR